MIRVESHSGVSGSDPRYFRMLNGESLWNVRAIVRVTLKTKVNKSAEQRTRQMTIYVFTAADRYVLHASRRT